MSGVTVIVGGQWGDEGKGKIVDLLSGGADICARFQGGSNAGHTVINDLGNFKLRLIPSGIFNPTCLCVMGAGTVIEPSAMLAELAELTSAGIPVTNLLISERAHLVLPYHRLLDRLEEEKRGANRIGTTGRGIGPAYTDKIARRGIVVGDLLSEVVLREKLAAVLDYHNPVITKVYNEAAIDEENLREECLRWGEMLRPYIIDTVPLFRDALREGKRIILEGQLSALKDIDWGSYPYVTSSSPTAGGASVGMGIPPGKIGQVIGVVKAYSTQVGQGPMPTELHDERGDDLRQRGHEFGVVTGRPRRVGWFDAPVTRYVAELNGLSDLAVTKLDILDTLTEIPVCVGYDYKGERLKELPGPLNHADCIPVYETLSGWQESTRASRQLKDLPYNARAYLERLSELVQVPLHSIGVGPHREETILV